MEKPAVVAAPDKDADHLFLSVKSGPDRDTMRPIKEPCPGWYNIDARHYLFWQSWPTPKAPATGPAAVPYLARLLPARTRYRVPVLLRCPDLPGPARCSRDTAMVAVFRLASSHPTYFKMTGSVEMYENK